MNFQNTVSYGKFSNPDLFSGISKSLLVMFTWKSKRTPDSVCQDQTPFLPKPASVPPVPYVLKTSTEFVPIRNPGVILASIFTSTFQIQYITRGFLIYVLCNTRGESFSISTVPPLFQAIIVSPVESDSNSPLSHIHVETRVVFKKWRSDYVFYMLKGFQWLPFALKLKSKTLNRNYKLA